MEKISLAVTVEYDGQSVTRHYYKDPEVDWSDRNEIIQDIINTIETSKTMEL